MKWPFLFCALITGLDADASVFFTENCNFVNEKLETLNVTRASNCVFPDQTSIISARPANKTITRMSSDGKIIWQRADLFVKAPMNLSINKTRLFVIGLEVATNDFCKASHGVLLILNAVTGKTLARKSTLDFEKELFGKTNFYLQKNDIAELETNCTGPRFTGLLELPDNAAARRKDAFKKGNLVLYSRDSRFFFVVSANLKKILWSEKVIKEFTDTLAAIRFNPDGKFYFVTTTLAVMEPQKIRDQTASISSFDPLLNEFRTGLPEEAADVRILGLETRSLPTNGSDGTRLFLMTPSHTFKQYELHRDQ